MAAEAVDGPAAREARRGETVAEATAVAGDQDVTRHRRLHAAGRAAILAAVAATAAAFL